MKPRLVLVLSLVSASAVAALVSACSGGDNSATDGGGDATTGDAQTSDAAGDAVADGGGDAANGCSTKGAGCRACCAALYPDAATTFTDLERACACTNPGDCKGTNVCGGSLCAGKTSTAACDLCLGKADAGDCFAKGVAACSKDTSCAPLIQCAASCPGPTDAGGGG